MDNPVRIPKDLFARLMAAIETPDDLTDEDRTALLEEADQHFPYDTNDRQGRDCTYHGHRMGFGPAANAGS